MCFLSPSQRRGALSFRKGKLGHLHIDVMVASRKKRAVPYGFGWGRGYHQGKAFVIPWEHLLAVSFSPFPSDGFFNSSFAPCPAQTFSPNRDIM